QEICSDYDGGGGDQDPARTVALLGITGTGASGDGEGKEGRRPPAQEPGAAKVEDDARHDGRDQKPAEGLDGDPKRDRPDDPRLAREQQFAPARGGCAGARPIARLLVRGHSSEWL